MSTVVCQRTTHAQIAGDAQRFDSTWTDYVCSEAGSQAMRQGSLDDLDAMLQHIDNEEEWFHQQNRNLFAIPFKTKFQLAREWVEEQRAARIEPFYAAELSPVHMSADETVNGFALFPASGERNLMTWSMFQQLTTLLVSDKVWTKAEWYEAMADACCTDWHKMDEHGQSYEGAWSAPEGTYAQRHAWDVCFARSRRAMWKLPFAKEALLQTIHWGCINRVESVRYSNFVCTWAQRKQAAVQTARREFDRCVTETLSRPAAMGGSSELVRLVMAYCKG